MHPTPHSNLLLFLAAGAGAVYALAFPPFSWPGVAFVSLAPLFAAVVTLPPARAALAGLLWTTSAALALGHWLPGTIGRFFEIPVAFGWPALLVVAWLPAGVAIAGCCAWAPSPFLPQVDADKCNACSSCVDACPMEALKLDDVAVVDKDRCIGCAVCIPTCSVKAMKLVRR